MKHSKIWHHGDRRPYNSTFNNIQVSDRSAVVQVSIPTKVTDVKTIEDALAFILSGINLQRISGFKGADGKFHRWSFSDCAGMIVGEYFFDSEKEVITWAQRLVMHKVMRAALEDTGISWGWMSRISDRYILEQMIRGFALKNPEKLPRAELQAICNLLS